MRADANTSTAGGASFRWIAAAILASAVILPARMAQARWMIVGCDEKTTWDDQGRQLFFPDRQKGRRYGQDPEAPRPAGGDAWTKVV